MIIINLKILGNQKQQQSLFSLENLKVKNSYIREANHLSNK